MEQDFDFFKTQMPDSRKADFYLGCLDSSVFIDFNLTSDNLIISAVDFYDKNKIILSYFFYI